LGLVDAQVAADRFGRTREPRVVGAHQGAGHHGRRTPVEVAVGEGRVERVHQHEPERRLGLRAAPVQRHGRYDGRGDLVLHQQVADLRPVPVREDDLDVVGEQVGDGVHRDPGRLDLVLGPGPTRRVRHGVSTEREQDPHGTNLESPATPGTSKISQRPPPRLATPATARRDSP
jgi:hypothetical protein